MINSKDRDILRSLAARQMEYALSADMQECIRLWKKHNDFNQERPMLQLELWTFEKDLLPQRLKCTDPEARAIEAQIQRYLIPYEVYHDDQVIPAYFPVSWNTWFKLFDHDIPGASNDPEKLETQFETLIGDLENDVPNLPASTWGVNRDATERYFELVEGLFGDILPPKMSMNCLYSVPTQEVVHRMSMEEMYIGMYDCPDEFKMLMQRIVDDTCSYFRWLENEKLLFPTVGGERLAQASYCFTSELPASAEDLGRDLTTKDVWGFMDSQETVSISPAMFGEFIFPYYKQIAQQFGLLSYGCCEPVNPIWDNYISTLPNLRKVSISPWCDEEFMGERLQGKRITFHRKPSPNFLGVSANLDEDALRAHFNKTISAAKGCNLEFSQRDVYTLSGRIENARRYVEILRECIDKNWKG